MADQYLSNNFDPEPNKILNYVLIRKEKNMETILSIIQEIDCFIRKKLSICNCNPCRCSNQTKDEYFQSLKETLTRFNNEWFVSNTSENQLFNQ